MMGTLTIGSNARAHMQQGRMGDACSGEEGELRFDLATFQPGQTCIEICIHLCVLAILSVVAIGRSPVPFVAHQ